MKKRLQLMMDMRLKARKLAEEGSVQHAEHLDAVQVPTKRFEGAFLRMVEGWIDYADHYRSAHEGTPILQDGFSGPEWRDIGVSLRNLLSADIGRLDGRMMSDLIDTAIQEHGGKDE